MEQGDTMRAENLPPTTTTMTGASAGSGSEPFAQLRETHSGLVMLCGDRAYKAKKPIVTDFLDFGSTAARAHALERELELNRRLAPDVYLGLAELSDPAGGPGEPILVMRRMPESCRLPTMAAHGLMGLFSREGF